MLHQPFEPSFVVDVSTVWERRMAAVLAYRSQFLAEEDESPTALSRPDFKRFLEARAIYFGAMIGAAYGEAFYLPGPLPLRQMPGLSGAPPAAGALPPYRVYG
jgi:LmbE family N-acetylglucosaminyl deacetylase